MRKKPRFLITNLLDEIPPSPWQIFNRYFLRHIHLSKQHLNQNFTCDHCKQSFQNSPLYSLAWCLEEIPYYYVYCVDCLKQMPNGIKQLKKLTKNQKKSIKNYEK